MSVAKKHRKHKQTTKKRYVLSVVNCYPHLCHSQKSLQQNKGQRVPGFNQCGLAHKKVWQKDNHEEWLPFQNKYVSKNCATPE